MKASFSRVRFSVTPWTVAPQAPLSMEFSRQEYWSGLLFPSPGDLPNPGIKPRFPALQADSLLSEPPGKLHQFSSVAQSCPTLCDPMNCSTPGLSVHHQLPELTQTMSNESVMPSSHLFFSEFIRFAKFSANLLMRLSFSFLYKSFISRYITTSLQLQTSLTP